MPIPQDHRGQRYGSITLETPVPGKTSYWSGICDCGSRVERRIDNLKRPGNHTCGRCRPAFAPIPSAPQPSSAATTATTTPPPVLRETATPVELPARLAELQTHLEQQAASLLHLIDEVAQLRHVLPPSLLENTNTSDTAAAMSSPDRDGSDPEPLQVSVPTPAPADVSRAKADVGTELPEELPENLASFSPCVLPDDTDGSECPVVSPPATLTPEQSGKIARLRDYFSKANHQSPAADNGLGGKTPAARERSLMPTRTSPAAVAVRPRREKIYPIQPGHYLYRDFYYYDSPEGLDLETTFLDVRESLGFCDNVADIQAVIKDYLYKVGQKPDVVEHLAFNTEPPEPLAHTATRANVLPTP